MLAKVPTTAPAKFAISTLDVEDTHIFITTMDGGELVARMWLTKAGAQRFEIWEGGKRYVKLDAKFVSLWRPIELHAWPFPLPTAATVTRDFQRPIAAPDLTQGGDFEEDASEPRGLYLGRPDEPPQSVRELEIRLLRALRTHAEFNRDTTRLEILYPRPLLDAISATQKIIENSPSGRLANWTAEDETDYHVDRSALNARPARWMPTPRDVSDYEAALDAGRRYRERKGIVDKKDAAHLIWLELMWKRDRWLFIARAKMPPIQWWQIADEERIDESKVKERYKAALEMVFRKVRGK